MDNAAGTHLATVNLFVDDIDKLTQFYAELFGFAEFVERSTKIFRSLNAGGVQLAFNGPGVYDLLGLSARDAKGDAAVRISFTVDVPSRAHVDEAAARASKIGGRVIKSAAMTAYNAWQTVLEDPEGNVFRVSHRL